MNTYLKGLFAPNESGSKSEKDQSFSDKNQWINDKQQRKFSLSLDLNTTQTLNNPFVAMKILQSQWHSVKSPLITTTFCNWIRWFHWNSFRKKLIIQTSVHRFHFTEIDLEAKISVAEINRKCLSNLLYLVRNQHFRYSKNQTGIASSVTTTISIEFHNWNCNSSTFNIPKKKHKTVKKMKRKTICIRITRANQDVTNFWGFPSGEVSPFKLCTCQAVVERKQVM